jgi:DNA-binding GntR family transcriptional regulator
VHSRPAEIGPGRTRSKSSVLPIRRTRLVDDVTSALRDLIARGELAPGQRLVQDQLAAELGISRTPLRDALQCLQHEGLVTYSQGRGLEVRRMEPGALLSLFEVREVIDGLGARLAAQRATPAELRQLSRIVDDTARAIANWDPRRWLTNNLSFHDGVIAAARNDALKQVISLLQQSERAFYPRVLLHRERAEIGLQHHRRILSALVEHDPDGAERVAREHIVAIRAVITSEIAEHAASSPRRAQD